MKPINDKAETVVISAVSGDEEGRKIVEKVELNTHNINTIRHVEKKMIDKGVQRQERHPADGLSFKRPPHKEGKGGKFTWEGPAGEIEAEMEEGPMVLDEGDPNYVEDEEKMEGEGEVEVAKVAAQGVARVDLDPRLNV